VFTIWILYVFILEKAFAAGQTLTSSNESVRNTRPFYPNKGSSW
jgi:hypothetical protein